MIVKRGSRWGARIYDSRTGSKLWLGTFDTRKEAKDAEREGLLKLRRSKVRKVVTCDEFASTWVERFPRPKESTALIYAQVASVFGEDFKGVRMVDVDRGQAREWALKNLQKAKVVRAMFNDALRDEVVDSNPFKDLRLPKSQGRRDFVVPTEDEVVRLILSAETVYREWGRLVFGSMIQLTAYSGLRLGEVCGLQWGDIDPDARTLRVERQWHLRLGRYTSPKSGEARTVFLDERALEAYRRIPDLGHPELFRTTMGRQFGPSRFDQLWDKVRANAGLPHLPFHGLRHFYGTYLARNDVGPVQIAAMMGHRDGGKLAMSLYIHMTEQDTLASVARALGHSGPRGVVRDVKETG